MIRPLLPGDPSVVTIRTKQILTTRFCSEGENGTLLTVSTQWLGPQLYFIGGFFVSHFVFFKAPNDCRSPEYKESST
jgi:hypothetical protein